MADTDEAERFSTLQQAALELEQGNARLQTMQNVILEQINARRHELNDLNATVDAAKMNQEHALAVLAAEQAKAEEAMRQRGETVRLEVMQLESLKAKREGELNALVAEVSAALDEKRAALAKVNQSIKDQTAQLQEIRGALHALKSTLMGVAV